MILLMQSQSEGMFQPLQNALSTFLSYIPQLIGALIILIVGYIVAKVLQALTEPRLTRLHIASSGS
jgi:hypothetical protein